MGGRLTVLTTSVGRLLRPRRTTSATAPSQREVVQKIPQLKTRCGQTGQSCLDCKTRNCADKLTRDTEEKWTLRKLDSLQRRQRSLIRLRKRIYCGDHD